MPDLEREKQRLKEMLNEKKAANYDLILERDNIQMRLQQLIQPMQQKGNEVIQQIRKNEEDIKKTEELLQDVEKQLQEKKKEEKT